VAAANITRAEAPFVFRLLRWWEGEADWRRKPCELGERGGGVGRQAVWDDLALVDALDHTVAT
jgi:hypothetical protein